MTLAAASVAGCWDSPAEPFTEEGLTVHGNGGPNLLTGDRLQLEAIADDPNAGATVRWTSDDTSVVAVDAGGLARARRPGVAEVQATSGAAVGGLVLTVTQRPGGYTAPEVDYFSEIAFGSEFGNASASVRKWVDGPRIRVNGSPTANDLATLSAVVADLGRLAVSVAPEIVPMGSASATVDVHFAPTAAFPSILPEYVPGNVGFVWVWWDGGQRIQRSVVLISTDVTAVLRAHLIREEVTQMLGLLRDSSRYPDSIFFQEFSTVTAYSARDEAVIEMLYRPELPPGTSPADAVELLRTLIRRGQGAPVVAWQEVEPVPGRAASGGS